MLVSGGRYGDQDIPEIESSSFRPMADYILVKPVIREASKYIQAVHFENFSRGRIVACGPGKRDKRGHIRPLSVRAGDFITFEDTRVFTRIGDCLLMREADIAAVIAE